MEELNKKIKEVGLENVAKALGLKAQLLLTKIKTMDFKISETKELKNILNLDNNTACKIFFK